MNEFAIENRKIGPNYPPLVIAEVGINHEGDISKAIQMVDAAKKVGAEVIKFQCHITHHEMIPTDMTPGDISSEKLYDIIKRCELTEEEEIYLQKYCKEKEIIYLSTPFSREAALRLNKMKVPAFKIGSGECNNLPLIDLVADFGKPIILSTGMNNIDSIKKTIEVINNRAPISLMHCTSMYPTPYEKVRLGAIEQLQNTFNLPVGLSDHSIDIWTCLGAVALGACILEKHFTISRNWPGPDVKISIEPNELKNLIIGSESIWKARGGKKTILEEEKPVIDFAYATVVSIKNIKVGDVFTENNIWVKRPGLGQISASLFKNVIGKKASKNIKVNKHLKKSDVINFEHG